MRRIKFVKINNFAKEKYEIYYNERRNAIGAITLADPVKRVWKIKPFFTLLVDRQTIMRKEFFDMSKAANMLVDLYEEMNSWEASLFQFD